MNINFWSSLGTVVSIALLVATLFNFITPTGFFSYNLEYSLAQALKNQANPRRVTTPEPLDASRIGILAGHWGDSGGYVCADGLTEGDVNLTIATYVRQELMKQGFAVDLLKEFDPRLQQYSGTALVSIHSGSCEYIDNNATGFKAAPSMTARNQPDLAAQLVNCLSARYAQVTGLRFINAPDEHMTSYHPFDEVNPATPTVILEAGFLNLDREFLTAHAETAAQGIVSGILCYLREEDPAAQEGRP